MRAAIVLSPQPGPKPKLKDPIGWLQLQGVDGQPVWFVISDCHKPSDQGSDWARWMPQLHAKSMP
jgi:hypothetical protein